MDTEFRENGHVIELISIALVAEDGRKLYCVSNEFDESLCDEWLQKNVLAHLPSKSSWISREEIRDKVLGFVDAKPTFWAYFADYDWVVFCQLFGRMIDLPRHFPMFCMDLKQWMTQLGVSKKQLPRQEGTELMRSGTGMSTTVSKDMKSTPGTSLDNERRQ